MYFHDGNVSFLNYTSQVLNDVHAMILADRLLLPLIMVTACALNIALLLNDGKTWRHTRTLSLPRLLIVWLASVDVVCVLIGLLPRVITLAIKPCPEALFIPVHTVTIFAQGFSILMSKFTVVVMGFERCASILAPFFYVRACSTYKFQIAELALGLYSLFFASLATFLNFFQYEDTHELYGDLNNDECHDLFLLYEFGSIDHEVEFPWRYSEIGGIFQFFQLVQDLLFVLIVVLCNSAVIHGLKQMNKRLAQICPKPAETVTADNPRLPDGQQTRTSLEHGKEFSRLISITNILVILLTTPQMVRNMCNYLHIAQSYIADYICQRVALCSACVNPIIYGLLRRKVRRKFKLALLRVLSICRINNRVGTAEAQRSTSMEILEGMETAVISEFRVQRAPHSLNSLDAHDTAHAPGQYGVF